MSAFDMAWEFLKADAPDPFRMKRKEMEDEVGSMRDEQVRRDLNESRFVAAKRNPLRIGLPKIQGDNEEYPQQQFRMTRPEMDERLAALEAEIARRGRAPLTETGKLLEGDRLDDFEYDDVNRYREGG
tara:strand:+ start:539 stop:922 length:384 start_codon:yes stop_codon:yes gene_type:complete